VSSKERSIETERERERERLRNRDTLRDIRGETEEDLSHVAAVLILLPCLFVVQFRCLLLLLVAGKYTYSNVQNTSTRLKKCNIKQIIFNYNFVIIKNVSVFGYLLIICQNIYHFNAVVI